MYVYIVIILCLIAIGFFIFIFSTAISSVQGAFNPMLGEDSWASAQHFNVFSIAAGFITNFWQLLLALLILGLLYWSWVYIQRKNAGGA